MPRLLVPDSRHFRPAHPFPAAQATGAWAPQPLGLPTHPLLRKPLVPGPLNPWACPPIPCCSTRPQATRAYQAGDRRLAKELGARGRWHNERMREAHEAAAAATFERRNAHAGATATHPGGGGGGGKGGVTKLDLHGLHVSEACAQLGRVLSRGSSSGRVRVVVGVGQHGKVPARLPAAVRAFLVERGVPFREVYSGVLEVSV